jgi:hypothetical protein
MKIRYNPFFPPSSQDPAALARPFGSGRCSGGSSDPRLFAPLTRRPQKQKTESKQPSVFSSTYKRLFSQPFSFDTHTNAWAYFFRAPSLAASSPRPRTRTNRCNPSRIMPLRTLPVHNGGVGWGSEPSKFPTFQPSNLQTFRARTKRRNPFPLMRFRTLSCTHRGWGCPLYLQTLAQGAASQRSGTAIQRRRPRTVHGPESRPGDCQPGARHHREGHFSSARPRTAPVLCRTISWAATFTPRFEVAARTSL